MNLGSRTDESLSYVPRPVLDRLWDGRLGSPSENRGSAVANPIVPSEGVLLGRARVPGYEHPRVITVRGEDIVDITSKAAPTSRDIAEQADPAAYVAAAKGPVIGNLHQLLANSWSGST